MRLNVRDRVDGEKPFTLARRLVQFFRCTQDFEEMQQQTVFSSLPLPKIFQPDHHWSVCFAGCNRLSPKKSFRIVQRTFGSASIMCPALG